MKLLPLVLPAAILNEEYNFAMSHDPNSPPTGGDAANEYWRVSGPEEVLSPDEAPTEEFPLPEEPAEDVIRDYGPGV